MPRRRTLSRAMTALFWLLVFVVLLPPVRLGNRRIRVDRAVVRAGRRRDRGCRTRARARHRALRHGHDDHRRHPAGSLLGGLLANVLDTGWFVQFLLAVLQPRPVSDCHHCIADEESVDPAHSPPTQGCRHCRVDCERACLTRLASIAPTDAPGGAHGRPPVRTTFVSQDSILPGGFKHVASHRGYGAVDRYRGLASDRGCRDPRMGIRRAGALATPAVDARSLVQRSVWDHLDREPGTRERPYLPSRLCRDQDRADENAAHNAQRRRADSVVDDSVPVVGERDRREHARGR